MKKNTTIFSNVLDFRKHEGIQLPSSKDNYVKKLHSFEGMTITRTEIRDTNIYNSTLAKEKLIGRSLHFSITIQRKIEAKQITESLREEEVLCEVSYTFNIVVHWKLYDKGILVYDNDNLAGYKDPKNYIRRFNGATLVKADIDKEWTKAVLAFTNELTVEISCKDTVQGKQLRHFFTIIKDAEPFIMHLDFAKPENIYYANEVVQLKVSPRKKTSKFVV